MSNDVYYNLMKEAQKEKIKLVSSNALILKRLYSEMAGDLIKRANRARGGFTKAFLRDFQNYMEIRYQELNERLIDLTEGIIDSSGLIAATVEGDFYSYLNDRYEINIPKEYLNNLYHVNEEVVLRMISGSFYKNGMGVSNTIWTYSEGQKSDISYIITKGMAEQRNFVDIIRDLEKYVDPNKKKDFDFRRVYPSIASKNATVDFNAQRLLRTSINHTFFNQTIAQASKNPFVEAIHWELSSEHYERQVKRFGEDECDDYARQDDYGLGVGNFPKNEVPIPHPCCLCSQYAVNSKSLDAIADDLKRWINGEKNPTLDEMLISV